MPGSRAVRLRRPALSLMAPRRRPTPARHATESPQNAATAFRRAQRPQTTPTKRQGAMWARQPSRLRSLFGDGVLPPLQLRFGRFFGEEERGP